MSSTSKAFSIITLNDQKYYKSHGFYPGIFEAKHKQTSTADCATKCTLIKCSSFDVTEGETCYINTNYQQRRDPRFGLTN